MLTKRSFTWLILSFVLVLLAGCLPNTNTPDTAVSPTPPADLPTPTLAPTTPPTAVPTEPTPIPAAPVPTANIEDLIAQVQADLPPGAFEGVQAFPLDWPQDERPLFVVHSAGFRSFDVDPLPDHFVAIYTFANGQWQEVANASLGDMSPDYLFNESVQQVTLEPTHAWLKVEGGAGAHGGTFHLLKFDGTALETAVSAATANPGVGFLQDLNNDNIPEVIIEQHDYYVFCYACGVRYLGFAVFTWDAASQQLQQTAIQPLPQSAQDHPAFTAVNRAVELAQAGLWPAAATQMQIAQPLAAANPDPAIDPTIEWDRILIDFYVNAWQNELNQTPYPLLTNIFYGDYAAALEMARAYSPADIFATPSILVQGTVAEGNETWMAETYLMNLTSSAIAAMPDLAAAYFFRAWAAHLLDPNDPQIEQDLAMAASLDPNEPLYMATNPEPIRIQFAPGAISATVSGELRAHQSVDYILRAMEGQTMTVVITSPTENVLLTIVGEDGIPLTNGLMSGASSWTGTLPVTQDYILRAIGTFDDTSYTLTVTIE